MERHNKCTMHSVCQCDQIVCLHIGMRSTFIRTFRQRPTTSYWRGLRALGGQRRPTKGGCDDECAHDPDPPSSLDRATIPRHLEDADVDRCTRGATLPRCGARRRERAPSWCVRRLALGARRAWIPRHVLGPGAATGAEPAERRGRGHPAATLTRRAWRARRRAIRCGGYGVAFNLRQRFFPSAYSAGSSRASSS